MGLGWVRYIGHFFLYNCNESILSTALQAPVPAKGSRQKGRGDAQAAVKRMQGWWLVEAGGEIEDIIRYHLLPRSTRLLSCFAAGDSFGAVSPTFLKDVAWREPFAR